MKVLVVGGGGREHALAWKIAGDSRRPRVFCAPGNAGTAEVATNINLSAGNLSGILAWAREVRPDLTVVGPEAPLCDGLVDSLQAIGLRVFGPERRAARLEGSKAFAKEVMEAAGVPTAWSRRFKDFQAARAFVREQGGPVVVKADGLAAGKGVSVCASVDEAEAALDEALRKEIFGGAGRTVLVEERLEGEEASILALVDGERMVMLASSQDHKRALDGDQGPNTGGMGAYSPAPVVTEALWPAIRDRVYRPTLEELRRRGIVFKGVLYAGLMIGADGPKVLEFNVRFGDPETQCILPRFRGDLLPALEACVDGTLREELVQWEPGACACVVMAAGGYPGKYVQGDPIEGLTEAAAMEGVQVFHAGTARREGRVVTAGGRVLGVTALGPDLRGAVDRAYEAAGRIHFREAHLRRDIAARVLGAPVAGDGGQP